MTAIEQRAKILGQIRSFFAARDFLELDTPILQPALVPELHVSSFALPCGEFGSAGQGYLLPSPELAMKQALCELAAVGRPRSVYQLAHCFRREAETGALHQTEFLLLELYALHCSPLALLQLVAELLQELARLLGQRLADMLAQQVQQLSFDQLCRQAWGLEFSPHWQQGLAGMQELYNSVQGTPPPQSLDLDDLFHLFLVEAIEPYIARHLPYCALYPYPDVTPLPARSCAQDAPSSLQSGMWVERWELYLGGVELANACAEENRASHLQYYKKRFCQSLRMLPLAAAQAAQYDWDIFALWRRLPDCSGAALGIDRLLALDSHTARNP